MSPDPTPPRKRRERIPEAETARRMLERGRLRLAQNGLWVTVDGLSFEDLIREAEVTRSAVFRIWKRREDFYRDLLEAMVRSEPGGVYVMGDTYWDSVVALPEDLLPTSPEEDTPERRRALCVEICRLTGHHNVGLTIDHPVTSTHFGLAALATGRQDAFGASVRASLRVSDERFTRALNDKVALFALVGRRPRPGLTFESLADALGAYVEGCALEAVTRPDAYTATADADPFDTGIVQPWSTAAIGFAALVLAYTENDPDCVVDPARAAAAVFGAHNSPASAMSESDAVTRSGEGPDAAATSSKTVAGRARLSHRKRSASPTKTGRASTQ